MKTRIDGTKLAAWRTFLTAHAALINRIEESLETAGAIPLTWYDVLLALSEAPEKRLRMHELAEAVVLSRSGLTRLVDKLERKGYLYREVSTTDRRGFYAVLKEEGLEELRKAWPVYAQGIETYFARLISEEEALLLAKVLGRVLEAEQGKNVS